MLVHTATTFSSYLIMKNADAQALRFVIIFDQNKVEALTKIMKSFTFWLSFSWIENTEKREGFFISTLFIIPNRHVSKISRIKEETLREVSFAHRCRSIYLPFTLDFYALDLCRVRLT